MKFPPTGKHKPGTMACSTGLRTEGLHIFSLRGSSGFRDVVHLSVHLLPSYQSHVEWTADDTRGSRRPPPVYIVVLRYAPISFVPSCSSRLRQQISKTLHPSVHVFLLPVLDSTCVEWEWLLSNVGRILWNLRSTFGSVNVVSHFDRVLRLGFLLLIGDKH